MRGLRRLGVMLVLVVVMAGDAASQAAEAPRVFVLDAEALVNVKQRVAAGDARYAGALASLRADAEAALDRGPFSVTDKTGTPASGDKHDYTSIGPYWWPNPETEDGLPYVRRDGERNPESRDETFDRQRQGAMTSAVRTLGLAYYFTDHEPYAAHAARLLRVWFLDSETRMNPHMEHAQAIPGRVDGRGIGIIDTAAWAFLIDAVGMIELSEHWSDADTRELQAWFEDYIAWLKTSDKGRNEQRHPNNHGTWYDAQIVAYMLFCEQDERAREQLERWTQDRIAEHFAADGRQPAELDRTRPWHYAIYNLDAYVTAARLARHVDVDLWGYETEDGRSIRGGIDYLVQYVGRMDEWPHEEPLVTPDPQRLVGRILSGAVRVYDDDDVYREAFERIGPASFERSRLRLTHPELFEGAG